MALRKMLAKRLADGYSAKTPAVTLEHSPISSASHSLHAICPPNAAKTKFHREYLTSLESVEKGFFRRFLHRRATSQLPEFLSLPVGEKLRERLKDINITGCRIRLDGLAPPAPEPEGKLLGVSVQDAKKLLKLSQLEKLKAKLREIPRASISYSEFVRVCVQECGNHDQGLEFANTLDHSGNVIVLGNLVCLRPEQVAKTMENAISQSIATPDDPRREQLEYMERQKGLIDQKARSLVRAELYCGLGFLLVQTLGFMRLTFWELSWDVMEPICFFVTSLHFALAYAFFLRTSTEPSFEGYFQRRFKAKQKKLMELHNFDVRKYNELCKLFYPFNGFRSTQVKHYQPLCQEEGCFASLK